MAQMLSLGSQSNLIFWSLHCCWATYKQSYAVIPSLHNHTQAAVFLLYLLEASAVYTGITAGGSERV